MFGKLKKSLRIGTGKKDQTEEEGLEALRKLRAEAGSSTAVAESPSAATQSSSAPLAEPQAAPPVDPAQAQLVMQQAHVQAQLLSQQAAQQMLLQQALQQQSMASGVMGVPGFTPPVVSSTHEGGNTVGASSVSSALPPKSIPEAASRSGSATTAKKHPGKALRKRLVKKPPSSRSPSQALNQSTVVSDAGEISGGERLEEVSGEDAGDHSIPPPVDAIPELSSASAPPPPAQLAPAPAPAPVSVLAPVPAPVPAPAVVAPTPVSISGLVPAHHPAPAAQDSEAVVMLQASDDEEEGPQFQEVTDVPPRVQTEARAVSSSSSSVSQSPVMLEVLPSPPKKSRSNSQVSGPTGAMAEDFPTKESAAVSVDLGKAPPSAAPPGPALGTPKSARGHVDDDVFSPHTPTNVHPSSDADQPEVSRPTAERRVLRRLVADRFVTIFSPTQYFGEVKGLKRVTVFDENVEQELQTSLVVAVRPTMGKHLLFDNLQLGPDDINADCSVNEDGCIETTMEMYSIKDGGRWGYVERERDAAKMLRRDPLLKDQLVSLYVTERQALMCRDGASKRLASLVVVWRPTSSMSKEDECPVHHKLKELYDPDARGLACALCSAGAGRKMLVLSEIVSPHLQSEVIKVVDTKRAAVQTSIRKQLAVHQRLQNVRNRAAHTVNEQFDALVALIESKRREFLDEIDATQRGDMDEIEASIDAMTDVTRLLDAARANLKCSTPLSPPQMATIATAIKSKNPPLIEATPQTCKVALNLADISSRVQQIPVNIEAGSTPNSMYRSPIKGPTGQASRGGRQDTEEDMIQPRQITGPRARQAVGSRSYQPLPSSQVALQACRPGTSLFNFPLHEMKNERGVEWRLRIEDSGDWLGIGVGVGGQLDEWAKGGVFDLHHLWIVPPSAPRVVTLRITPISNGNMKLTIHRPSGQQLDDGRIPHWHCTRTAFPQVSFAGRQGRVTMVATPFTL